MKPEFSVDLALEMDECLAGKVTCNKCGHTWAAVAPLGTVHFECPECHSNDGELDNPVVKQGAEHWVCACGNFYFGITREGIYCSKCGKTQEDVGITQV